MNPISQRSLNRLYKNSIAIIEMQLVYIQEINMESGGTIVVTNMEGIKNIPISVEHVPISDILFLRDDDNDKAYNKILSRFKSTINES